MNSVAYVAAGGNLGTADEIRARFGRALAEIAGWPEVARASASPVYRSAPVGPVAEQPDFLNAAFRVELSRPIAPVDLVRRLLAIEAGMGRSRGSGEPGGPRSIDLDLIMLGGLELRDPGPPVVEIPHPRAHERGFVLRPLADLGGDALDLPGRGPVGQLDAVLAPLEQAGEVPAVPVDHEKRHRDAEGDRGVGPAEQK